MTITEELLMAQKIEPLVIARLDRIKKKTTKKATATFISIVNEELECRHVYDPADQAHIRNLVRRMCCQDGIFQKVRLVVPPSTLADRKRAAANDKD